MNKVSRFLVMALCLTMAIAAVVTVAGADNSDADSSMYYVDFTSGDDSNAGTSEQPFKTFEKAVETAQSGDIIVLNSDMTTANSDTILSKSLTIDLNDNRLTLPEGIKIQITGEGNVLTIKNGELYGNRTLMILCYDSASVNMDSVMGVNEKNENPSDDSDYSNFLQIGSYGVNADSPGFATIKNCNIKAGTNVVYILSASISSEDTVTSTCLIEDSTLKSRYPVSGNGNCIADVTIRDSTLTGEYHIIDAMNTAAVYWPGAGNLVIEGGTYTGGAAVYIKSGDVEIRGGFFNATAYKSDYQHVGSGCHETGDTIIIDNCGYPGGTPVLSIRGGVFSSDNAYAVASYAGNGQSQAVSGVVRGGTFHSSIQDGCMAEGYSLYDTGNGLVPTFNEAEAEAHIGEIYYETLEDALIAVESGETIVFDNDITWQGGKNSATVYDVDGVTIDLNGKTLASANFSLILQGDGFTIRNGNLISADSGSYSLFIGDERSTSNVLIEEIESNGGFNFYNVSGVTVRDCNVTGTNYYAVWADENAFVVVESGSYSSEGVTIFGTATISEGVDATITVNGGTFTGNNIILTDGNRGPITIYGGTFDKEAEISGYVPDGYSIKDNVDGTISVIEGYRVQFIICDLAVLTTYVPSGEIYTGAVPEFPVSEPGYGYTWVYGDNDYSWTPETIVTGPMEIIAMPILTDITITITAGDNGEFSMEAVSPAEDIQFYYYWLDSQENELGEGQTIKNLGPGTYQAAVMATDGELYGTATKMFTYRAQSIDEEGPTYDISHSGDSVELTVSSEIVFLESGGSYENVDIGVSFTDTDGNGIADVQINGTVESGTISLSLKLMDSSVVSGVVDTLAPSHEASRDSVGVDVNLNSKIGEFSMIIKIPIGVSDEGKYVGSAAAYYIENDGSYTKVTSRVVAVSDDNNNYRSEIWIYTYHNTEYIAIPLTYSDVPVTEPAPEVSDESPNLPPYIPDDDDLPFIPPTTVDGGSSDESVKIIACAAAAAAAALMGMFLIFDYRKR